MKIRRTPQYIKGIILGIIVLFIAGNYIFPSQADQREPFTFKWMCTTNLQGYSPPVTKDINGDGIHEIFIAGLKNPGGPQGRIVCIDGQTGNLIWEKDYKIGYVDYNVPLGIADLDNNGDYEVVHVADMRTVARHAESGSEFWNVSVPSGFHQFVIADVDGTGYPYVYVSDHTEVPPYTKISKIRGYDGALIAQADMYYSCYGGVSCADLTGDGEYEILVTDRSGSYGPQAKGVRCYDEELNLLWYEDDITCSSHCAIPVDINNDGVLEVVAMKQGSGFGGIYVLNADGSKVPGKCSLNLGLDCHAQPAVYDIDKDGNIELITADGSYAKVWDLGDWALEAILTDVSCSEPPDFANVMGNNDLEIIACSGVGTKIYDRSYSVIASLPYASASVVQDIDGDGYNEIIFLRDNSILVYDTLAEASFPRVRTDTPFYSERRANAGVYIAPIIGGNLSNIPPNTPNNPNPENHATNVSIDQDLSWVGGDPNPDDEVLYDVYFGPFITPHKVVSNQSEIVFCPGELLYDTLYYWRIVSWDNHGASTTGPMWKFTTMSETILIKNMSSDWNFFSLFFNQSVSKNNLHIKYNGCEYVWTEAVNQTIVSDSIFGWDRINQTYHLIDILVPGEGYVVFAYQNCELLAVGVDGLNFSTYITDLIQHWNLIGLANNEAVEKQNLIIHWNDITYTWDEAVINNIIVGSLYLWDEAIQSYQLSDLLRPRNSYWMYTYHNCTVLLPTV